jgi:hypothetical protein
MRIFHYMTSLVITKDFHFAKNFPLIRGKSFAIMTPSIGPARQASGGHRGGLSRRIVNNHSLRLLTIRHGGA